jgi:hypothetical protein
LTISHRYLVPITWYVYILLFARPMSGSGASPAHVAFQMLELKLRSAEAAVPSTPIADLAIEYADQLAAFATACGLALQPVLRPSVELLALGKSLVPTMKSALGMLPILLEQHAPLIHALHAPIAERGKGCKIMTPDERRVRLAGETLSLANIYNRTLCTAFPKLRGIVLFEAGAARKSLTYTNSLSVSTSWVDVWQELRGLKQLFDASRPILLREEVFALVSDNLDKQRGSKWGYKEDIHITVRMAFGFGSPPPPSAFASLSGPFMATCPATKHLPPRRVPPPGGPPRSPLP